AVLTTGVLGLYYAESRVNLVPSQILAESRERIFMKGFLAFAKKPVFGWGWAQYSQIFAQTDWPVHYSAEPYVDRAHSSILEVALGGGIIAVSIYLFLISSAIYKLVLSKGEFAKIVGVMLVVYLVHSQTNVTSVAEELFMWYAIGIAITLDRA
ncbi:MAG: O-antigen ligase family protein, partial [Microgenomates group bacterium]